MKILIDARFYGVENTGIGRYVMNLVHELQRIPISECPNTQISIILRKKYFDSLKIPDNWKKILCDVPHYTFREQLLLPLILYKEKPDIFHAPQINVPIFYFGKTVVTVHDTTQLDFDNNATTLGPILYFIKQLAIKVVFQKIKMVNKIICDTHSVERDLIARGVNKENIETINIGFNELEVKGDKNKILRKYSLTENYFVYVGNAYPHKNVEFAINSICNYNKGEKNKIDFAIVSARNSFVEKLYKHIKSIDASGQIKLLGFVPDRDLGTLLANSLGFIFPSKKEGFGLPGLEAISAGTLLLASDIPVFREVYGNAAKYFDPENTDSLVSLIEDVAMMPKKKGDQEVTKAKAVLEKYSWEKMAKDTLKIYKKTFLDS